MEYVHVALVIGAATGRRRLLETLMEGIEVTTTVSFDSSTEAITTHL